jgi:hypothetical protein
MRRALILLTLLATSLAVGLASSPAAEARTYCGKIVEKYSYGSFTFKTYRLKGHMTCKAVRSLLKKAIPAVKLPHGWDCVKLHTPPPYDVTCGSPVGAEDYTRAVGAIGLF